VLFHRSLQRPATTATRAAADPAATGTAASGTTPAADPAPADNAGAIEVDPTHRVTPAAAVAALREKAREKLTAAIYALTLLRRDTSNTQNAYEAARDRIVYASREKLDVRGYALAKTLEEMERETWLIRDELTALLHLWSGVNNYPVRLWSMLRCA
jgi:hypothetical protein